MSYVALVKQIQAAMPCPPQTSKPQGTRHPSIATLGKLGDNLDLEARLRLTQYQNLYGNQNTSQWLEHLERAHAAAVATFPTARQHNALKHYKARYCYGSDGRVLATHALALELWAADKRARPFGLMLEAACRALGLIVDELPEYE